MQVRSKAAIAPVLAVRLGLLLLDVSVQSQVLTLFKKLHASFGFSIIPVTHDLPVVTFLCDDILVMKSGRVVESGPTGRVVGQPETDYARLLVAAAPEPPQVQERTAE